VIHEQGHYRRFVRIGPGGWKCPCCAPAPGKALKDYLKATKRSERMTWKKELIKELETVNEE
jgi:hypothetical protein